MTKGSLAFKPMTAYLKKMSILIIPFNNTYTKLPEHFFSRQAPTPVTEPLTIAWNTSLASSLNIRGENVDVFSGNIIPDGAEPIAQLYCGHQFGSFNPQLGDGRAILLGEVIGQNGKRHDIQLKGSGPTKYSRMGDGRAWLGPVLREYLISEAMHKLRIPTTRALAAVGTGELVYREQGGLPGAILTRTASSHLRVGTFQVFAHRGDTEALQVLTDYAISRHYPQANDPMEFLSAVCSAHVELVTSWMSVGFIHGVMNTDNCTISGETIDYGPCAFMDAYDEMRVFSSIDKTGRYAYGNQSRITIWNMAQLATAIIQLYDDKEAALEQATAIIHTLPDKIQSAWLRRFSAKIGISDTQPEDRDLIEELLRLMEADGVDFTNIFHALKDDQASKLFKDRDGFGIWKKKWSLRKGSDAEAIMTLANPQIIPRNHQIEAMINAALAGDMKPFENLQEALSSPFNLPEDLNYLCREPKNTEIISATFCGT